MTTLLLRLAGPWQSWGSSSRFVRRETDRQPTKSGVVGLLAAALGRRRTDPLEDLLGLSFGVRLDQPGHVERDFQTARSLDEERTMPLSQRYYLADAVFLAGVSGESQLLDDLDHALRHPTFPLYLGRRSCPPVGPVTQGVRDLPLPAALRAEPWAASAWWQRRHRSPAVTLEIVRDADAQTAGAELVADAPISFDPRHRQYGWRAVVRESVTLPHPSVQTPPDGPTAPEDHDPFRTLEEL